MKLWFNCHIEKFHQKKEMDKYIQGSVRFPKNSCSICDSMQTFLSNGDVEHTIRQSLYLNQDLRNEFNNCSFDRRIKIN